MLDPIHYLICVSELDFGRLSFPGVSVSFSELVMVTVWFSICCCCCRRLL